MSARELHRLMDVVALGIEKTGLSESEVIDRLALVFDGRTQPVDTRLLARFVDQIRRMRMRRNDLAGAPLFRDPAWDMLLELYAARGKGTKLSVSSLCYASGVPLTTAFRHLQRLEQYGLIERKGDCADARRCTVIPTRKAMDLIGKAATMLMDQALAIARVAEEEEKASPGSRPADRNSL
jgi:DNA-binding MarR family transcriptional regulator